MRQQPSSEYRGYRTAGIRLSEELKPELASRGAQRIVPLLPAVHMFDKAHVVMLAEQGLLRKPQAAAMLAALRDMEREGVEKVRVEVGGGLHSGEQYLIRRLGEEVGGRMHLGRSSGDVSSVAINIRQREGLLDLAEAVNGLRGRLLDLADRHAEVVLPGYTFLQHAQPLTFGHMMAAWAAALARDAARLLGTYGRVNVSPAGAVIMGGTDFPIDRHRTAFLLGFDGVHDNTEDAILELSPDDHLDCFASLAILDHTLARFADDIILWSTSEFGFVDVPDRFCGTSSIMMQKKNVIGPQEIKGAAAESLGGLMAAFHALKGPTGLPITERYFALETLWRGFGHTVRHLGWLGELLEALRLRPEAMREGAWRHWATATDLAGALVRERDLPWRTAHQIVGIVVRWGFERGFGPQAVTGQLLDEAAVEYFGRPVGLGDEAIRRALDPDRFVRDRTLFGGPSPQEVRRRLPDLRKAREADAGQVAAARGRLRRAAGELEVAIDRILRDG